MGTTSSPRNVFHQSASAWRSLPPPHHHRSHGGVPAWLHGHVHPRSHGYGSASGGMLRRENGWIRLLHPGGGPLSRGNSPPMPQRLRLHCHRHFKPKVLLPKRFFWFSSILYSVAIDKTSLYSSNRIYNPQAIFQPSA